MISFLAVFQVRECRNAYRDLPNAAAVGRARAASHRHEENDEDDGLEVRAFSKLFESDPDHELYRVNLFFHSGSVHD